MQRILIVKTTSMGDVIHALPVVSDIKKAFPACSVDWMVEAPFADLVRLHPGVDHVIPVALRVWRRQGVSEVLRQRRRLCESLATTAYDFVLDLQGLVKSAFLAKTAKGVIGGPGFAHAREPLASLAYQRRGGWDHDAHAVERLRQLAAGLLGYHLQGPPDFAVAHASNNHSTDKKTAWFLHATAREEKAWPLDHWQSLAKRLRQNGFEVALPWGTDYERLQAERIAAACEGVAVLPKMPLGHLAAEMARAQLVVGVDTGLTHLAAALHLPLVALFFATPQWRFAPRFNPHAVSLGDIGMVPGVDEVFEACMRACRVQQFMG